MEYVYYATLTWLLLFVSGLPFCLACLPASVRSYAVAFAPSLGYCYLVFVSYYLYRADLAGANTYARAVFAVPAALLLVFAVRAMKRAPRVADLLNRDVSLMSGITVLGFWVMSIPFLLAKHGVPTPLTIGNLDIAELAINSRFLQEFSRSSTVGILGQTGHFVLTCDDVWFGPSAIVALVSSLLHSEPYKLQILVMSVLASQGIGFVYLLARIGLDHTRVGAAGIALVYALSPVVMYTVWHSFGAQMIAMPLLLGVVLLHIVALRHIEAAREYRVYAPSIVILLSGILVTYHFMVLIVTMLLLAYSLSDGFFTGRLPLVARISIFVLGLVGVSFLLNPLRFWGLVGTWAMYANSNNGWFIPWLSPDLLFGANTGRALLGGARPGPRIVWALVTIVALVASVLHSLRMPRRTGHLSFLVGLVLPVWILGLYFAVVGMEHRQLGGYRSFKITSTFAAFTLLALSLFVQARSWSVSRVKVVVVTIGFVAIVSASVSSIARLVYLAHKHAYVLPDEVIGLQQIERLAFVKGIDIPDTDNFSLLWINYFTFRKQQMYQRFPYGGRPVGPPDQDYSLTKTEGARAVGFSRDMIFVDTSTAVEKHDINRWFMVYRASPERAIVVARGEGWMEADKNLWCGVGGGACSVWVNSRSEGVRINVEARFGPLRDGEQMAVRVNGQPIRVVRTASAVVTEPFVVNSGRTVVTFSSSLGAVPAGRDPQGALIRWRSVVVRVREGMAFARGSAR